MLKVQAVRVNRCGVGTSRNQIPGKTMQLLLMMLVQVEDIQMERHSHRNQRLLHGRMRKC